MGRPAKLVRLAAVLAVCLLLPACKTKVTKANFEKIKEGMTLAEVEKILGKGTKETGDGSNIAAQAGVDVVGLAPASAGSGEVFKWEGGNNEIILTFRDGKVVHKRGF